MKKINYYLLLMSEMLINGRSAKLIKLKKKINKKIEETVGELRRKLK